MLNWMVLRDSTVGNSGWLLLVLALLSTLVAFSSGLVNLLDVWASREEYSHGFFIPILSGLLLWHRRTLLVENVGSPSLNGFLIFLGSLTLLFIGELGALNIIAQIGFVLCLIGLVLAIGGSSLLRVCITPILFLLFAIPMPNFIDSKLSWGLQLFSSRLGVDMLRMVDISVYLQGNMIDLGYYKLQVVEACSGLRYLYPLLSLGAIAAYLYSAPLWKRVFIVLSVIPIVVFMNSFRIAVIGILVSNWGTEMADGFLHLFQGWLVFMSCAALLLLEVWLLDRTGQARPVRQLLSVPQLSVTSKAGTRVPHSYSLLVVTVTLVIASVVITRFDTRGEPTPVRENFSEFPMNLGPWSGSALALDEEVERVLAADDYLIADFAREGGNEVNFYMAYYASQREGRSVHSPRVCIPGGGWTIKDFKTVSYELADGSYFPVNRAEIELNTERQLVYYWFEQRGRRVANEYLLKWYLLLDSISLNRTDGALVRVTTAVGRNEDIASADARIGTFISDAIPLVPSYVPERRVEGLEEDAIL